MNPLLRIICCVLPIACFSAPLYAQATSTSSERIGPYEYMSLREHNPFLQATDKQFRPVADFLINKGRSVENIVNGHDIDCVKAVFVGVIGKDVKGMMGNVYDTMRDAQASCATNLRHAIQPIAEAAGVIPRPKMIVDSKAGFILDPRVYARAKKMVPSPTTTEKNK